MKKIYILSIILNLSIVLAYSQTTRRFYDTGEKEKIRYDELTELIKKHPDSSELYSLRGEIVFNLNVNYPKNKLLVVSNEDALKDINKAIETNPEAPLNYKILSDYFWHVENNLEKAIEKISLAVENDQENPAWLNRRGFLRAHAGLNEKACEDWEKCSKMSGKEAEICKRFKNSRCN